MADILSLLVNNWPSGKINGIFFEILQSLSIQSWKDVTPLNDSTIILSLPHLWSMDHTRYRYALSKLSTWVSWVTYHVQASWQPPSCTEQAGGWRWTQGYLCKRRSSSQQQRRSPSSSWTSRSTSPGSSPPKKKHKNLQSHVASTHHSRLINVEKYTGRWICTAKI